MSDKMRRIVLWTIWLVVVSGLAYFGVSKNPIGTVLLAVVGLGVVSLVPASRQYKAEVPLKPSEDMMRKLRLRRLWCYAIGLTGLIWVILTTRFVNSSSEAGWFFDFGIGILLAVLAFILFIANEIAEVRLRMHDLKDARRKSEDQF